MWSAAIFAATLTALIRTEGEREPLPFAKVVLTPRTGQTPHSATADESGRVRFANLEKGRYLLQISPPPGRTERPLQQIIEIQKDQQSIKLYLAPPVLPKAERFAARVRGAEAIAGEEVAAKTLSTQEINRIPGTLGDPLRAVENLPGAARPPFNTGLFIIEGARPGDSRVYLAGAELPQLYHYGGFTSIFPGGFLSRIDYVPHNFSPRYGRATAGTIDVDLRPGKRDRLRGALDINPVHAAAEFEGPLGKGSFLLGVRRSYVDGGLALLSKIAGDPPGLRFLSAPVYWDYQGLLHQPVGGGELRVFVLGSDDQLALLFGGPQESDPSINGTFATHVYFHRVQARYRTRVLGFQLSLQQTIGVNGTELSVGRGINLSVRSLSFDLRLEAQKKTTHYRLLVGLDSQNAYVWLNAKVPAPLREGELVRPPGSLNQVQANEEGFLVNLGAYAELTWLPLGNESLRISPGLRADVFGYLRKVNLDPRFSLSASLTRLTTLKVGAGFYTQDPAVQDYFGKDFGNPLLRLERAAHLSLSLEQAIVKGLTAELTGLYKHLWDFAAPSSALRRTLEDPLGFREHVASLGSGHIYGGTALLRYAPSQYAFGWISYSLLRSQRRDCEQCPLRTFDFDQTHVLIVVAQAKLPYRFEVGLRFRYISGFPTTPVKPSFYDSDADLYQPQAAGPQNSIRLPATHQLDLRIDRTFTMKTWLVKIYLDISNVYNNPAPEQRIYSYDFTQSALLTGLPIVPSLGIRSEF